MSTFLKFRTAGAADLESVATLVNSAYRGDSSRQGWTTEAHLLGGQRTDASRLAMLERIEVGLDPSDRIIACLSLKFEKPETAYVGMLTVDPTMQGGGYGKQLLDHAEMVGREWNCKRMRMTVIHLREELLAYYFRRGYVLTGASEPFPIDDPGFGIPRVEGMKLLELEKVLLTRRSGGPF